MLDDNNIPRPMTRTLAVIDGGLNVKNRVPQLPSAGKPKLLEQVRQAIRTRHYSYRTEKAYVHWIKRFIYLHNKRHPWEMAEAEIAQFLSALASESHVSASTQNQALNALLFLYKGVLEKKIGLIQGVIRANRPKRLPVVLTKEEVKRTLACLDKAEKYAAIKKVDVGVLLNWRLTPDMKPLIHQVQSACDYVKAAAAWLSGQTPPRHEDNEQTVGELRARILKTVNFAESVAESQYANASDCKVSLSWAPPGKVIRGNDYLLQMTIPNVYFHIAMAYAIFRNAGVDVGKMDFLGPINFVEP